MWRKSELLGIRGSGISGGPGAQQEKSLKMGLFGFAKNILGSEILRRGSFCPYNRKPKVSKFSGAILKGAFLGPVGQKRFLDPLSGPFWNRKIPGDFSFLGCVGLGSHLLIFTKPGPVSKRAILGNLAFCTLSDPPGGSNPGFGLIWCNYSAL